MPIIIIESLQEGILKPFSKIWESTQRKQPQSLNHPFPVSYVYFLHLKVMEWKIVALSFMEEISRQIFKN